MTRFTKGLKNFVVWVRPDFHEQVKQAAEVRQEPMSAWIRRAIEDALARDRVGAKSKAYERCSICGDKHDKSVHG